MGGAILIAAASIVSRLLGLLRDRLLFSTFGASDILDSYYVAFRLPDLLFQILILGALSSAFIPKFLEVWKKGDAGNDHRDAWQLTNIVLTMLLLLIAVLAVLAAIFAPQLMPVFAPGFSAEKLETTVHLTRIMLLSVVLFVVSNMLSGVLNAFRKFAAFAVAPILYNVGIIAGIILLYPRFGLQGLAWGVVIGAFMHMAVQIPVAHKLGYRFRWAFTLQNKGANSVFRMMAPRMLGLGAVQLEQVVSTMIASTLAAGSVAVFHAANNLQSFPINIFGVSLAVSSFPVFSEAVAAGNIDRFVKEFSRVFRRILFFIVPCSVMFVLLRAHIVRLVLGAGEFNWEDTVLTAQTLGFFALSLFAQSLIPMIARSFYALQDTATPVKVSIIAVVLNILGGVYLGRIYGVEGIALSFSIVSSLHMMTLLALLRLRLGMLDDNAILNSTIKIIIASGCMAAAVWATLHVAAVGVNQQTFVGLLLQAAVAAGVGGAVYILLAFIMRFDEVRLIASWLNAARRQILRIGRSSQ